MKEIRISDKLFDRLDYLRGSLTMEEYLSKLVTKEEHRVKAGLARIRGEKAKAKYHAQKAEET